MWTKGLVRQYCAAAGGHYGDGPRSEFDACTSAICEPVKQRCAAALWIKHDFYFFCHSRRVGRLRKFQSVAVPCVRKRKVIRRIRVPHVFWSAPETVPSVGPPDIASRFSGVIWNFLKY